MMRDWMLEARMEMAVRDPRAHAKISGVVETRPSLEDVVYVLLSELPKDTEALTDENLDRDMITIGLRTGKTTTLRQLPGPSLASSFGGVDFLMAEWLILLETHTYALRHGVDPLWTRYMLGVREADRDRRRHPVLEVRTIEPPECQHATAPDGVCDDCLGYVFEGEICTHEITSYGRCAGCGADLEEL